MKISLSPVCFESKQDLSRQNFSGVKVYAKEYVPKAPRVIPENEHVLVTKILNLVDKISESKIVRDIKSWF